jgi:hypothetical protein
VALVGQLHGMLKKARKVFEEATEGSITYKFPSDH